VGDGPGLVWVHGAGANGLVWWQQVPHFAPRRRVVTYDQRGFGRSSCPPSALDASRLPGDLGAVMTAAGLDRAALVCQSLGGWAGLPFALAQPGRVSALVLCGTPGGVQTPGVAADMAGLPGRAAGRTVAEMALGPAFVTRDPERAHLYASLQALNPPDTLPALLATVPGVALDPAALAGLAVPTLVVGGSADLFFGPATLAEVAARIPGARHEVWSGAGHSPWYERPAAFNARIDAFLESAGA